MIEKVMGYLKTAVQRILNGLHTKKQQLLEERAVPMTALTITHLCVFVEIPLCIPKMCILIMCQSKNTHTHTPRAGKEA